MNSPINPTTLLDSELLPNQNESRTQKLWRRARRFFGEYGYLLIAALIPAVIVYLLYLVRGIYPFGDSSVLVLDLNGQYISFYEALHDILHGDADLFYSFSRNLGGEFLGIYDYYVASPFALLLGLFPERFMLEGLLIVFIIKAAMCGLFMGIYLHKHASGKPNRLTVITFSLLYALSSYCIVQQHNSMWIDAVMWLPLLALGIESLIRYGKFRLYVFSLAIIIWSNFYIGYMVVIFTVLYCIYDYFAHSCHNENNPLGEKMHLIKSIGRVLLWSVLGVGIAALVILSARYSLAFGKNEFSNPNWEISQKFDLFEFFQKFLPSSYDTVRPAGRPIVYCGILTLMLIPAYFVSKKFSMREKVASALFILLFIASFAISTLDLIWHGFQKPNWLNYRYSFMLCFLLVVLAYKAFDRIEFTSRKVLLASTAFIALYVLILPELGDSVTLKDISTSSIRPFAMIWLSIACLLVYFIIISLYGKLRARGRETASIILVVLVCVELFLSGMADMEELGADVVYTKYSRYNNMIDTFRPITYTVIDYDAGFYRMEKIYERKTNDHFALQMNGLSLSTSTLNRETITFLHNMGYDSKSHNSHYVYKNGSDTKCYATGTPVSDSLLGIKYLITDKDYSEFYGEPLFTSEDYGYDEDFKPVGNYDVYQNPYALSLIYGVSDDLTQFDADDYSSPFERINAMVTAMLGEDETVMIFVPATQIGEVELDNVSVKSPSDNHLYYVATDTSATATMTYRYEVPVNTSLYYYVPTRYYRATKVNDLASNDHVVPLGTSEQSEFEIKITLEGSDKKLYIDQASAPSLVYYIDMEVYEDAMTRLAATQVTIDEDYRDSHLFGSVTTTQDDQMMFTSIPYDEGWKIYVDGERVETEKSLDALVSFRIDDAGEHRIELRYMPTTVAIGLTVSISCGVIFILLMIAYPFLKRIPVLRNIVGIHGEPLPELMTPERAADIAVGDIGYVDKADEPIPIAPSEPNPAENKEEPKKNPKPQKNAKKK